MSLSSGPGSPVGWSEPPLDWPHYGIGFLDAVKRGYRKYATFSGRASPGEYWWFGLFVLFVWLALGLLSVLSSDLSSDGGSLGFFGYLAIVFYLGSIIPSLALTVRRLHDAGRSGAYYLCTFIPIVGGILLLVFVLGSTNRAAERFGPPYSGQPGPQWPGTAGHTFVPSAPAPQYPVRPSGSGRTAGVVLVAIVTAVLVFGIGEFAITKYQAASADRAAGTAQSGGFGNSGSQAGSDQTSDAGAGYPSADPTQETYPYPTETTADPGEDPLPSALPSPPPEAVTCYTDPDGMPFQNAARGNDHTTCPFARRVAVAYGNAGGNGQSLKINAYSPVTHKHYKMSCDQYYSGVVECDGGVDAIVYLY